MNKESVQFKQLLISECQFELRGNYLISPIDRIDKSLSRYSHRPVLYQAVCSGNKPQRIPRDVVEQLCMHASKQDDRYLVCENGYYLPDNGLFSELYVHGYFETSSYERKNISFLNSESLLDILKCQGLDDDYSEVVRSMLPQGAAFSIAAGIIGGTYLSIVERLYGTTSNEYRALALAL